MVSESLQLPCMTFGSIDTASKPFTLGPDTSSRRFRETGVFPSCGADRCKPYMFAQLLHVQLILHPDLPTLQGHRFPEQLLFSQLFFLLRPHEHVNNPESFWIVSKVEHIYTYIFVLNYFHYARYAETNLTAYIS